MSGTPDVIAVGETMLSMVALDGPLEEATSFRATHGGAESNACVALVRSGRSAAWVSRLGADPIGDRILAALKAEGVDLSWVTRDPERPTGLMLRDVVGGVRYYRAGSAASGLSPDDLDDAPVEDARAVFSTGITVMLGQDPGRAVHQLFRRAGGRRVLDLNLRKGLWGSDRAVAVIEPLLRSCDLLFGGLDELQAFEEGSTPEALARAVTRRGPPEVVVKRGRAGAGALDPEGRWFEVAPEPVVDVDPVGAGDAFDAGYLDARLDGADVREALLEGARRGAAIAATLGDAGVLPGADDGAQK